MGTRAGAEGSRLHLVRRLHAFGIKDFVTWYSTKDRDTTGKQVDVR